MRNKTSIIVPIIAIIAGVLLQLCSLGILSDAGMTPAVIYKLWPLILAVVGLDLLVSHRRLIGGLVMLLSTIALLTMEFSGSGSELWRVFLKFWPILLVLFGLDIIFSGRGVINAIVLVIGLILVVYVILAALDVPLLRALPIDLSSVSEFFTATEQYNPAQSSGRPSAQSGAAVQQQEAYPITYDASGNLAINMPQQNAVQLNLNAASGRISLKSGGTSAALVGGTVNLDAKESLTHNASLSGQTAVYTLTSKGSAAGSDSSSWDLSLSSQRAADLNVVLNTGYVKADLRGMNLNSVSIQNKFGPVDVMAPQSAAGKIRINAGDGAVRLYLPKNVRVSCSVSGTDNIEYPERNYTMSGNVISPRNTAQNLILVEIVSNNGQVRIIESE